ncbi:MAG: phosphatidate cytidylyltransferase [Azoarcus sp.]|jgi:phosphatidate cytidylyltransferase|nr:phosphatidate cytidylyltransferase [Azoarcus sp.]
MLRTRIVTALVMLTVLLGALFFLPVEGWFGFCAMLCAVAAWEWGGLAGWSARARVIYALALGVLCLGIALSRSGETLVVLTAIAIAFWVLIAPLWLRFKWPLRTWSAIVVGVVVLVPATLAFIVLRNFLDPLWVIIVSAIVWVADITAYFSGRAFGGKKLAPSISPGKTWAGAIGAIVGVVLYGLGIILVQGASTRELLLCLPVLVALTALSIVGDLFESLLKRQTGIKDSSNLLPGHGGVLDRIDSLTSTLPVICLGVILLIAS